MAEWYGDEEVYPLWTSVIGECINVVCTTGYGTILMEALIMRLLWPINYGLMQTEVRL